MTQQEHGRKCEAEEVYFDAQEIHDAERTRSRDQMCVR